LKTIRVRQREAVTVVLDGVIDATVLKVQPTANAEYNSAHNHNRPGADRRRW